MKGHASHGRLTAFGQGDVENPCGLFGIAMKKLVEITQAIEEQRIGYAFLNR